MSKRGDPAANPHERGAALLAILLLVAVMAGLSVLALDRLKLSTSLSANGAALDQARAFAFGAENLALARVADLNAIDETRTTLAGGWNTRVIDIPLPDGSATARVRDAGNCFNLNSLAQGQLPTALTARESGAIQFVALMQLLGIPQADARHIAAALADWLDTDSIPNPDGAEDDAYARAPLPYRPADTLLADPSELRAVAGVTPAIYARLKPWICTLPVTDLSPLNVNTLTPDQAPLVAMLLPGKLDLARARAIIEARPADGWSEIADFWRVPALTAVTPTVDVQAQPALRTRWFALNLDVEVSGAQLSETALIDGGLAPPRLVSRRWGSDE